jgi:hypothetical protein
VTRASIALTTAASLLAIVVAGAGCRRHRSAAPVKNDPVFGAIGARHLSTDALADDVRYARALLTNATNATNANATPPKNASARGSRVFLSVFAPPALPLTTTALDATLGESIAHATELTRARFEGADVSNARIEIDVATAVGPALTGPPRKKNLGRIGLARALDATHFGFVLPNEIFTRRMLGEDDGPDLDGDDLDAMIEERLGEKSDAKLVPFETVSVVESHDRSRVLPLHRGLLPRIDPAAIDPPKLNRAIVLAADYLSRIVGDDGRFVYVYDPLRDADDDTDYSMIRHAGAADGLLEAYGELHDPKLLDAAERALDHLVSILQVVSDPNDPSAPDFTYLPDDDNAYSPIGGTGLALIAFSKHAAVTGKTTHLERMRSMARFLVKQLDVQGVFQPYFPPNQQGLEARDVLYYPGEAMLGLVRLHAVDPDARWLEAAERAAHHRASEPRRARDFWYLLACAELHRITHDELWADKVWAIADATADEQDKDEQELADFGGSYGSMLRASPTSTALEALAATVALARFTGHDGARWFDAAKRMASFVLWEQLDEDAEFYVINPAKALGGVRTNPWGSNVRIDNDQHAILGWLWLMRVMRDPFFGAK